jgi:hypothetical protein
MAPPSPFRTSASVAALAIAAALTACTGPETGTLGDAATSGNQEEQATPSIDIGIDLEQPLMIVEMPYGERSVEFLDGLVVGSPASHELDEEPITVHDALTGELLMEYTPEYTWYDTFGGGTCNYYHGVYKAEDGTDVMVVLQDSTEMGTSIVMLGLDAHTGETLWETAFGYCPGVNYAGTAGSTAVLWGGEDSVSTTVDLLTGAGNVYEFGLYEAGGDLMYNFDGEESEIIEAFDLEGNSVWREEFPSAQVTGGEHQLQNGMFSVSAETVEGTEVVASTLMVDATDGTTVATLPALGEQHCVFDAVATVVCASFDRERGVEPTLTGYALDSGEQLWQYTSSLPGSNASLSEYAVESTVAPGYLAVGSYAPFFGGFNVPWTIIDAASGEPAAPQIDQGPARVTADYVALGIDEDTYATYAITWP